MVDEELVKISYPYDHLKHLATTEEDRWSPA
jgi:hypothetical protein